MGWIDDQYVQYCNMCKQVGLPVPKPQFRLNADKDNVHINTFIDMIYLLHASWAVRKLKAINPKKVVDIASPLYISCYMSAYFPFEYCEWRPIQFSLDNLTIREHVDIRALPHPTESEECAMCLHTIEHIGLGRYGDPLDPLGDKHAADELQRIIKPGGKILIAVPLNTNGRETVTHFNAHREYYVPDVIALFDKCSIDHLDILGGASLIYDVSVEEAQKSSTVCIQFNKK
jgi:hypothetical protein